MIKIFGKVSVTLLFICIARWKFVSSLNKMYNICTDYPYNMLGEANLVFGVARFLCGVDFTWLSESWICKIRSWVPELEVIWLHNELVHIRVERILEWGMSLYFPNICFVWRTHHKNYGKQNFRRIQAVFLLQLNFEVWNWNSRQKPIHVARFSKLQFLSGLIFKISTIFSIITLPIYI